MTEAEWLACDDPELMLDHLREKVSDRRWRLLLCASCRSVWHQVTDPRSRRAVEMCERYADGNVNEVELVAARREGYSAWFEIGSESLDSPATEAAAGAFMTANEKLIQKLGIMWHFIRASDNRGQENATQVVIIRDIFGNPFRPVTFAPKWRTDTVRALAAQMYESRDFSAMPILADALQDAGCDSDDILNHCRGPGPHVRGCWVVDLVLGKE